MPQPYKVFTIYAREDAAYLEELRGQLRPLEIAGRIKVWSDREINPGVDWEMEIVHNLDTADIILILVSSAYYNSVYIHEKELKYAFERHDKGQAKVLPIIVRPCSFGDDPGISRLQVLPTDGKPVTDHRYWQERDDAWLDVVAGLKRTLDLMLEADKQAVQAVNDAAARKQAEEARKKEAEERARQAAADKRVKEERERLEAAQRSQSEQTRLAQEAEAARAREAAAAKAREKQAKLAEQQRAQQVADQQADRAAWQQALEANQVEGYQRYLVQFPQGEMVKEAQARIKELKKEQATPAPWGRYAAFGGGGLVLLVLIWLVVKMFRGGDSDIEKLVEQNSTTSEPPKGIQPTATFSFNYPMERVQGGTFQMGSPTTEKGRNEDECQHTVPVNTFYIGRYEVTQAQWEAVMGNNPSKSNNCDDCPVEQVSWNDVQDFIQKLNQKTGKTYRLPTEAEWEYAAKGGNQSKGYPYSGSQDLRKVAWYRANASLKTHPVGQKTPNELGLYDMSGNVWEWCQDLSNAYPNCKTDVPKGTARINRGGSWFEGALLCRTAFRFGWLPDESNDLLGFRLALSL